MTPGYSVFSHSTWAVPSAEPAATVSPAQYEEWKKTYTFRAMKHSTSYGEDFCDYFDKTDFVLCYTRNPDRADAYIKKHYVK